MQSESKLLALDQITIDYDLYPRTRLDWIASYNYSQKMLAGEIFPPITVAFLDGKYILIDGAHRIEATKTRKQTAISANVLSGLSRNEILEMAIKANITHGRPLSPYDVAQLIVKLQDLKYDAITISNLVKVPVEKLTSFVVARTVQNGLGESTIVKSPLKHLNTEESGRIMERVEFQGEEVLSSRNQGHLIDELTFIIEKEMLELPKVAKKLYKLKVLLNNLKFKKTKGEITIIEE